VQTKPFTPLHVPSQPSPLFVLPTSQPSFGSTTESPHTGPPLPSPALLPMLGLPASPTPITPTPPLALDMPAAPPAPAVPGPSPGELTSGMDEQARNNAAPASDKQVERNDVRPSERNDKLCMGLISSRYTAAARPPISNSLAHTFA
jgi:hypothetical protein